MNSGAVTVIWSSLPFGHTHPQNPSDIGIPFSSYLNDLSQGWGYRGLYRFWKWGCPKCGDTHITVTAPLQKREGNWRRPKIVSGIVTGDATISYWPLFSLSQKSLRKFTRPSLSLFFYITWNLPSSISLLYLLQNYNCCWVSVDEILTRDYSLKSYSAALYE